ncbi:hypothetical protein BKA61DRAFT_684652 [Leptodontidium sp. MPI-SDFR-AT-0119]|nr:hypothetical protein BKA61DRAFT_684652 [Leptodontidium sp. MPI-SDFR-AT-0119]
MTYEYLPSPPNGFDRVKTYWLDIGGCGSSSFLAKLNTAFSYTSPAWKSSLNGRVVFVASYLYNGGTNIELKSNGHIVCDTRAVYRSCDNNPRSTSVCKVIECSALYATPKSREALVIVRHDSFDVIALDPRSRYTSVSVVAYFLYEKSRLDIFYGLGGALYLADTVYE